MKNLLRILWAPVLVFVLQMLRRWLLPTEEWMDMIAHFLGGVSIAWMTHIMLVISEHRGWSPGLPGSLRVVFILSFVALIGVLWEFHEYLFGQFLYGPFIMTLSDTLSDLALDVAGAIVCSLALETGHFVKGS